MLQGTGSGPAACRTQNWLLLGSQVLGPLLLRAPHTLGTPSALPPGPRSAKSWFSLLVPFLASLPGPGFSLPMRPHGISSSPQQGCCVPAHWPCLVGLHRVDMVSVQLAPRAPSAHHTKLSLTFGAQEALAMGARHSLPPCSQDHSRTGLALPGGWRSQLPAKKGRWASGSPPRVGRECAAHSPGLHGRGCQGPPGAGCPHHRSLGDGGGEARDWRGPLSAASWSFLQGLKGSTALPRCHMDSCGPCLSVGPAGGRARAAPEVRGQEERRGVPCQWASAGQAGTDQVSDEAGPRESQPDFREAEEQRQVLRASLARRLEGVLRHCSSRAGIPAGSDMASPRQGCGCQLQRACTAPQRGWPVSAVSEAQCPPPRGISGSSPTHATRNTSTSCDVGPAGHEGGAGSADTPTQGLPLPSAWQSTTAPGTCLVPQPRFGH